VSQESTMSDETTINPATRLARALRLEDLLINASAVPIPISLSPSAMIEPASDDNDTLQKNTDTASSADHNVAAQIQELLPAIPGSAPGEGTQDAVVTALQAARSAIGMSLRHDMTTDASPLATAPVPNEHAPNDDVQSIAGEHIQSITTPSVIDSGGTHDLDATSDMGAFGQLHSMTSNPLSSVTDVAGMGITANPLSLLPDLGLGNAASPVPSPHVDTSLLDNISNLVTQGTALLQGALPALPGIIPQATTIVGDVPALLGGATELVHEITTAASAPLANVASLASLVSTLGILTPALGETGTVPAAPLSTVGGVLENVTVPSLNGTGIDFLVGLLQPSVGALETHQALATPAHTSLEDLSIGTVIGIDDIVHPDHATHAVHSLLPQIGTGLI
jgi:hypothetical protein